MSLRKPAAGASAAKAAAAARTLLTPLQVRCLGALLLAAQVPQAVHLPIWIAAAGILLVGVRIGLLRRDRQRPQAPAARIPSWALVLFAVAAALAVRSSYGYLVGRDPSVAFLYILVAIKYLETRSTRDGTLLVCLACFLLVTPFVYSQSLLAALAALPAVVLVGVALDALRQSGPEAARGFTWQGAARRSAVTTLQGLPVAALLFVLFPRLASPLWGLPAADGAKTGLSDSMAPGQIAELSLSDAVAFRVDFDGPVPPAPDRYWRGPVFASFDGTTWSPGLPGIRTAFTPGNGPAVTYTVTLEPNYRPWLFALELPASAPQIASGALPAGAGTPMLTRDQQLLLRMPVAQSLRYRMASVLRGNYPSDPAFDARGNLGLGKGNPRTVEFARSLRAQGKSLHEATLEACHLRFRPILMTAFAFILGTLPLVRASGAGAESRKVMGMSVFAGMLIATILAVLLIPVLFALVERLGGKKKHDPGDATAVLETAPANVHGGGH